MDKNKLNELEQYRKRIVCNYVWYTIIRILIIVLCLVCVGFLTYWLSGICKQLQISLLSRILMIVFIAHALLLAGFVIYRLPIHNKRVQTALARLEALIHRGEIENIRKDAISSLINSINGKADARVADAAALVKNAANPYSKAVESASEAEKAVENAKAALQIAEAQATGEADSADTVENAKAALKEANTKAAEAAQKVVSLKSELDKVKGNAQKVNNDVAVIKAALEEVQPVIDKINSERVINLDRELQLIVRILES